MTPNNNIRPDFSTNYVYTNNRYQPPNKPEKHHSPSKDFEKYLDNAKDKPQPPNEENPELKAGEINKNTTDKALADAAGKKATQPTIDDSFNQIPTISKDAKVAPKLGTEIPTAPSEEPRSKAFIELAPSQNSPTINDETIDDGDPNKKLGKLPETMPLQKVEMKPLTSIIELNAGPLAAKPAIALDTLPKEKKSPADLYSQVSNEGRIQKQSDPIKEKNKNTDQENSGLNLTAGQIEISNNALSKAETISHTTKASEIMKQLADKLVDEINVLADKNQTDTTITLKYPPIFEGATVTITSYATARGEFNINFNNLTQQAKNVLDMAANRTSLADALDQKGFTIHIISTETIQRNYGVQDPGLNQGGNRNPQNEQQEKQQKQKQK